MSAICGVVEAACVCVVEGDQQHDGPHVCKCGGSWDTRSGEFEIFALPGTNPEFEGGAA